MSDLVADTGRRLFGAHAEALRAAAPPQADATAPFPAALWADIEAAGLPLALLSEDQGGFGLDAAEALQLVQIAAAHAAPVPLAETMLANWLLAAAGLDPAEGPAAVVSGLTLAGGRVTGKAPRVPWGRDAAVVVALAGDRLMRLTTGWQVDESHNIAAEPRDTLTFDTPADTQAAAPVSADTLHALMAMLRAQALAGALDAALNRTVAYANERMQFGRAIGKFQAIQQSLAVMATEVAAARAGAGMAAAALPLARSDARAFTMAAAAAKLRAGEAAGIAAGIAHQVHGAIGFTAEYPLHPLTRRLWAWRDECGSESHWAGVLGDLACTLGRGGFWPFLTGTEAA